MTRCSRRALLVVLASLPLAAAAGVYVDFFRAVGIDNLSGVREALLKGLDPNTLDDYGQTGLHVAIREDSPRVIDLLLQAPGIAVDTPNRNGETPLMMAAIKGRVPLMKALLAKGAQVNRAGWTPLHYAAACPDGREGVALLLAQGAQVEARAPNGTTPLMMAARYGSEAALRELLAHGARLDTRNDQQRTALDFARNADRDWMLRTIEKLQAAPATPR